MPESANHLTEEGAAARPATSLRIRHILCPLDFTELSDHAVEYAVYFAQTFETSLHFLHVRAAPVLGMPYSTGDPTMASTAQSVDAPFVAQALENAQTSTLEAKVEQVVSECRARGLEASGSVMAGHAPGLYETIVEAVHEQRADLVVMGTHGRSGIERLFAGSVAEGVLRHTRVPILAIPAGSEMTEVER